MERTLASAGDLFDGRRVNARKVKLGSSLIAAALIAVTAGCSSKGEVREWRAEDHDHAPGANAQGQVPMAPAKPQTAAERGAALVDASWSANCASCHGPEGRGDGPTGPMVKAPDLTRPELLDKASDADLAKVVGEGRGKMPKFDLPPEVIAGLVKRIRLHKGR